VRRPLIHSLNLADLLPVSSPYTGVAYNPNPLFPPNSPPLAVVATGGATPLYYNIHQGDVGHTLVFGPTGAGKSVHLAQMAASFKRYENASITVFDKGWSMYALAALTGGAHYALAAEEGSPGLCPLSFLDDAGDIAWAEDWLATCYELQTARAPTPAQKGEIHRAITLMAGTGRDESRSLSDFLTIVQDAEIREALRAYSLDGPLGELLDASEDSLSANPFLVFELDELMAMKEAVAVPVLLYLFRRIEKRLTGAPALLVLDEAWVMLGHPVFAAKIREWLKTLRKANCAVVMATQSLSDAWRSGLIDVLVESCPTRIFLGNPEAHMHGQGDVAGPHDIYAAFGLNDVQIDIIQSARPKRQFYYTSPDGNRLCDLTLGPVARAVTAVSSKEDVAALRALAVTREGKTLVREWLASKGVTIDADTV
jgi:type IV secretion system protein VirB4